MVHGRGAGPRNILELVQVLDHRDFAYLAPAAANGTWYPYSFMAEISKNEPFLSSAIQRLDDLVRDLESRGLSRAQIALLGFSQGACLASEFVIRHPARYGGLIAFSGGLIGPPGTTWPTDASLDGIPAFFGCSDIDAHVPLARVEESAAHFTRCGATVTKRIYPGMGHEINEDEIEHAKAILDGLRP